MAVVAQHGLLALIGGGEHARVVAEAAAAAGWTIAGIVDHRSTPDFTDHLGTDADLPRILKAMPDLQCIMAFGDLSRRRVVSGEFRHDRWATIVHPTAFVSDQAILDPGVFIGARAVVQARARVGAHAIINTAAVVEHDVVVGPWSHLCPGAVVGGGVRLGSCVCVGLNAAVRDHVTIGDGVTVGMGSAVVADVAAGLTVLGVPARSRPGA